MLYWTKQSMKNIVQIHWWEIMGILVSLMVETLNYSTVRFCWWYCKYMQSTPSLIILPLVHFQHCTHIIFITYIDTVCTYWYVICHTISSTQCTTAAFLKVGCVQKIQKQLCTHVHPFIMHKHDTLAYTHAAWSLNTMFAYSTFKGRR